MTTPNQGLHAQAWERLNTQLDRPNDAEEWELVTNVRLAFGALRYAEAHNDTGDDPEDFLEAAEKALERAIDILDNHRLEKRIETIQKMNADLWIINDEVLEVMANYLTNIQNNLPDYSVSEMQDAIDRMTTLRDVAKTLTR